MVDFKIEGDIDTSEDENTWAAVAPNVETLSAPSEQTVSTPLRSLKDRRTQIVTDLYTDLRVPRWENPQIFVRFNPINTTKMNASLKQRSNSKVADWPLRANTDVLVDSCIGIYAVYEDDPEVKLSLRDGDSHGSWTKFDPDLCDALGINPGDKDQTVQAVKGLYFTYGDIVDAAERLLRFSNISNDEADGLF